MKCGGTCILVHPRRRGLDAAVHWVLTHSESLGMNGGVAHVEADLVAATRDEAHEDCWPETSRWAKRDERIMKC